MKNLIHAEILKIFSVRTWWILLLSMCAWVALNTGVVALTAGAGGSPDRASREFAEHIWSTGSTGTLFALVMGILLMSSEFQTRTITTTFLITPKRDRVIAAKVIAGAVVGVVFGVVAVAVTAAIASAAILSAGASLNLMEHQVPQALLGTVAGLTLYLVLGVGIASLVKSQTAALVGGILWVFLLEPILVAIPDFQVLSKWLPGGAATALSTTTGDFGMGLGAADLLPVWAAIIVLAGYGLAAASAAVVTTVRQDIA